jgi:hypothetical protein
MLFERACEAGDLEGCHGLALQYHYGDGVDLNKTRAEHFLKIACDGGYAASCTALDEHYRDH